MILKDKDEFINQLNFCSELMTRLKKSVEGNIYERYNRSKGVSNYELDNNSQLQTDVTRLRRELMTLGKMMVW